MKKFFLFLICLCTIGIISVDAYELPRKTDHDAVTIYMFRGSGCSHCFDALNFFNETMNENPELEDYITFKIYETWMDTNNSDLFMAVADELGDEAGGVPYIVIGDGYHQAGFASSMGDDIINAALEEYENDKYIDVVQKVMDEGLLLATPETLNEACIDEGIVETDDNDGKGIIPLPDTEDEELLDETAVFNADEEGFFALGVASILLFISIVFNTITLPLSIVFIILYIKEKKKNKKEN